MLFVNGEDKSFGNSLNTLPVLDSSQFHSLTFRMHWSDKEHVLNTAWVCHRLGSSCFSYSIKINLLDVLAGYIWVLYLFALFGLALQAHFQGRDEDPRRQKRASA